MINLLYVITKLELGGAQKQLLSLVRHLDKNEFNIFLFTAKDGLLLPDALSIKGIIIKTSSWLERRINPLKDLFALVEIYCFIKKNKIGIVHTHSSKAGILGRFAARLANIKAIIHTVHGFSFNDYQPAIKRLCFICLERLAGCFTNRLIVVSEYDRQKGLANYVAGKNKYSLIRYGIDYNEFDITNQKIKIKQELGIGENDLLVTMIACFKPQKSPQDFIKAARLVKKNFPDVKFLLVGDGILRNKIEKLIRKFKLNSQVILAGWRRDIPEILSLTDIFVITSFWEGLPITVLEAAASSKPVIATNTGGVQEVIVDAKSGYLFPPGNIKAAARKAAILLKNKALRKQFGEAAKNALGDNYRIENMVKNTENLYSEVLCSR